LTKQKSEQIENRLTPEQQKEFDDLTNELKAIFTGTKINVPDQTIQPNKGQNNASDFLAKYIDDIPSGMHLGEIVEYAKSKGYDLTVDDLWDAMPKGN